MIGKKVFIYFGSMIFLLTVAHVLTAVLASNLNYRTGIIFWFGGFIFHGICRRIGALP